MEANAMLVLTRRPGEKIHIGGDITIIVVNVKGTKIRLGIDAPKEVAVLRAELKESLDPTSTSNEYRSAVRKKQ
jgi:carbon storage regulator